MSLKRKVDNAVRERRRQAKLRRRRRRTSGQRADVAGLDTSNRPDRPRRSSRRERPLRRQRKIAEQRHEILWDEEGRRIYPVRGIIGR